MLLCTTQIQAQNFDTHTEVYGVVQDDINECYKIVEMEDGSFGLGGVWNGQAYLMKTSQTGEMLQFETFESQIGGTSVVLDMVPSPDGGLIAVGECTNCLEGDSIGKVFLLKVNSQLQLEFLKKYGAEPGISTPTTALRRIPSILAYPGGYLMASSIGVNLPFLSTQILARIDEVGNLSWSIPYYAHTIYAMEYSEPANTQVNYGCFGQEASTEVLLSDMEISLLIEPELLCPDEEIGNILAEIAGERGLTATYGPPEQQSPCCLIWGQAPTVWSLPM